MALTQRRQAVVVGGNRIPFARSNGPYATASNQEMLVAALDGLADRFGLGGQVLGELLDERGSGRGLISICAAGGQGVTAVLEK